MTGPSWLIDSKRIATKIKYASESVDPSRIRWISNPTKACPDCNYLIDNSDVVHEWPGLPQGVKFDPSDQELLGHLLAKVGKNNARPHPFINEFIPTVDEDDGICYTHPQKLPGVKLDGSASHFFHRTFKAYNTGTRKRRKIQQNGDDVRWHKTGKTKPFIIDGVHVGCKKILVLYSSLKKGEKSEKTNWVMHQYHLGTSEDENNDEFVVSKVFYQQQQPLKSFDNNKREVEDLPMTMVETLEVESFVAVTSEPELAFPVHDGPSSRSAISTELCIEDAHHLGQVSSHDVVTDNSIAINECEGAPNPDPGKIVNQDNDSQLNVGDDSKWWEGESQFLLDSQQLAEGIALCNEFLQSQSSCGGEVEEGNRIKPFLLSEYALNGGVDDFKKDLEECQTLSTSHFLLADRQQQTTGGLELLETPPDMRLSQLEFGSQDTFLA